MKWKGVEMMEKNIRIAKELVKMAKNLVANEPIDGLLDFADKNSDVLNDPNGPLGICTQFRKFSPSQQCSFMNLLEKEADFPKEKLIALLKDGLMPLVRFVKHPQLDASAIDEIVEALGSDKAGESLADFNKWYKGDDKNYKKISPKSLKILAKSNNVKVRARVAADPNTDIETLRELCNENWHQIKIALASNHSIDRGIAESLIGLLEEKEYQGSLGYCELAENLAKNPVLTEEERNRARIIDHNNKEERRSPWKSY